jgi:hypothetical protein
MRRRFIFAAVVAALLMLALLGFALRISRPATI